MDLDEYRTRITAALDDHLALNWEPAALDTALAAALAAYSRACPQTRAAQITLRAAGSDISLGELPGFTGLLEVIYPWSAANPASPLRGWILFWDALTPHLLLPGLAPQAGETLSVIYTALHSIAGLAGADESSIPAADEALLVQGAAGYAARARVVRERMGHSIEFKAAQELFRWSRAQVDEFTAALKELQPRPALYACWPLP